MRTRFANLLMYALLSGIAVVVILQSYGLPNPFGGTIGAGGFPIGLAIATLVLCAIGALRTIAGPAGPVLEIRGLRKALVTLAAMVALFGLWQAFGYFFPLAFVFLSGLLCLYAADKKLTWRMVLINIAGAAVVLFLIYLFFTHVLYIRF